MLVAGVNNCCKSGTHRQREARAGQLAGSSFLGNTLRFEVDVLESTFEGSAILATLLPLQEFVVWVFGDCTVAAETKLGPIA
jgi:hypothetical protein